MVEDVMEAVLAEGVIGVAVIGTQREEDTYL